MKRVPRAFLSVILVALLAWVAIEFMALPCPVCEGTGTLPGAEGLEVKELHTELVKYESYPSACDKWVTATYVVNILAENSSTDVSLGYLYVAFYLTLSEEEEAAGHFWFEIPIYVEIAPETTKNIEETVVHGAFEDEIFNIIREGVVIPGLYVGYYLESPRIIIQTGQELECPYCSGVGRMSLAEWLRVIMR